MTEEEEGREVHRLTCLISGLLAREDPAVPMALQALMTMLVAVALSDGVPKCDAHAALDATWDVWAKYLPE